MSVVLVLLAVIVVLAVRAACRPFVPCPRCHAKPKRRPCSKCHGFGKVLRPTRKAWAHVQRRAGHLD